MIKKYTSKRNNVYRVGPFVVKVHKTKEKAAVEAEWLKRLDGKWGPKLYAKWGNRLILKRVKGMTLAEYIDVLEGLYQERGPLDKSLVEKIQVLSRALINWFKGFYEAQNYQWIHPDMNCRNFIIQKKDQDIEVIGLDFESYQTGAVEENIGQLMAFVLHQYPDHTRVKTTLAQELEVQSIQVFQLKKEVIQSAMKKEIKAMKRRRAK